MNPRKEKALRALLTAPTKKAAAEAAGISERTLREYIQQEDFQAAYNAAMSDLVDDATQKAKAALAPALAVLDCIANDPEAADTSRIAASRGVLEYGLRLIETTDIIKRLEALEVNNEK